MHIIPIQFEMPVVCPRGSRRESFSLKAINPRDGTRSKFLCVGVEHTALIFLNEDSRTSPKLRVVCFPSFLLNNIVRHTPNEYVLRSLNRPAKWDNFSWFKANILSLSLSELPTYLWRKPVTLNFEPASIYTHKIIHTFTIHSTWIQARKKIKKYKYSGGWQTFFLIPGVLLLCTIYTLLLSIMCTIDIALRQILTGSLNKRSRCPGLINNIIIIFNSFVMPWKPYPLYYIAEVIIFENCSVCSEFITEYLFGNWV